MMRKKLMSFLFGSGRARSKIAPVTPFNVEPAAVPSPEAAAAAEMGRHKLLGNIVQSEERVASMYRRIANDALDRVRAD